MLGAPRHVDRIGGEQAGGDARGDGGGREQEQHRHEHDLRGDGRSGADVQAHARGGGEADDQRGGDRRVERATGVDHDRHQRRDRDQRGRRQHLDAQLARRQPPGVIRPPPLEQPLSGAL
jgi:hypothetical protein